MSLFIINICTNFKLYLYHQLLVNIWVGIIFIVLASAYWISSCKWIRIEIGTQLGGGGRWEWTPRDIKITNRHFSKLIGINLENLILQDFWIIDPYLIVFPAWWGWAIKKINYI